ncbi:MAG: 5-oxoprolinase subunit PxpB [Phycisphaerales bacterium]|nr:5-oxoprolinase subunit PxpB [Phycisphaerales bacterium]
MQIETLSDASLLVIVGKKAGGGDDATAQQVRALADAMRAHPLIGVHDIVPSYRSIGVHYDPLIAGSQEYVRTWLNNLESNRSGGEHRAREIVIPVCYGGPHGPDLADVAKHTKLSPQEIITLHSNARYIVRAVGFVPGFAYLAGLPEQLATPRKAAPRTRVPAGSVAIAGLQTGVYPLETPGGWQIIGRTSLQMFQPNRNPASLLQMGDHVRFQPMEARP